MTQTTEENSPQSDTEVPVSHSGSRSPSSAPPATLSSAAASPLAPSLPGRGVLIIAGLFVIAAGLKSAQDLFVPFLLSSFIAILAATPLFWLRRKGVPNGLALTLVIVVIILGVVLTGALLAQSTSAFSAKLPFYQERLFTIQSAILAWLSIHFPDVNAAQALQQISPGSALSFAGNTLARLGGALSNSFLISLTVIFILAEAASIPQKLTAILSDPKTDMPHFARFVANMNRYVAIKTSASLATGVLVTTVLSVLGIDFAILWGLLALLLNFIPNIGSVIAAIPPVLLAMIQFGLPSASIVALAFVVINVFMGNFIEPRFMGRELGLSTLVVFLSLIVWGWILGPVGMLLSVPLTMTAKIALETNPQTHWLAYLLGPAEPKTPRNTDDARDQI